MFAFQNFLEFIYIYIHTHTYICVYIYSLFASFCFLICSWLVEFRNVETSEQRGPAVLPHKYGSNEN